MAIKFVTWVGGLTNKPTPNDADELYVRQESDNTSYSSTWANIKTALGAIFAKVGAIGSSGLTIGTGKLAGRGTAGTGALEEITLGTNLSLTGTTLNAAGGSSLTLDASKLAGRGSAGGTGAAESITLGTNLSMTGTTLNASGGGGTPAGTGTELQYRNGTAFGAVSGSEVTTDGRILTASNGNAGIFARWSSTQQIGLIAQTPTHLTKAGVFNIGVGPLFYYDTDNGDTVVAVAFASGKLRLSTKTDNTVYIDNGTVNTFRDLKLRNLIGTGSLALGVVAKTVDYTATANDGTIEVDATSAARTITLFPCAGNVGKILIVKKIDVSANAVTVDANASETIDGAATTVLSTQWAVVRLQVNAAGTAWIKV